MAFSLPVPNSSLPKATSSEVCPVEGLFKESKFASRSNIRRQRSSICRGMEMVLRSPYRVHETHTRWDKLACFPWRSCSERLRVGSQESKQAGQQTRESKTRESLTEYDQQECGSYRIIKFSRCLLDFQVVQVGSTNQVEWKEETSWLLRFREGRRTSLRYSSKGVAW